MALSSLPVQVERPVLAESFSRPPLRRPNIFHCVALLWSNHHDGWITVANLT